MYLSGRLRGEIRLASLRCVGRTGCRRAHLDHAWMYRVLLCGLLRPLSLLGGRLGRVVRLECGGRLRQSRGLLRRFGLGGGGNGGVRSRFRGFRGSAVLGTRERWIVRCWYYKAGALA